MPLAIKACIRRLNSFGLLVFVTGLGVVYRFSSLPVRSPPFGATPVAAGDPIAPLAISSETARLGGRSKCERLWEPVSRRTLRAFRAQAMLRWRHATVAA